MADIKEKKSFYCEKCGRTMDEKQFYGSLNLDKYPEGKLHQCKKCITMHVDNWNPDTYLWLLQECDVPYIPEEWTKLMSTYAIDKSKVTGTTIFGRYLSKMKLNQFNKYRWKDTAFLQELEQHKREEAMKRLGYSAAEITLANEKAKFEVPEGQIAQPIYEDEPQTNDFVDNSFSELTAEDMGIDLSEDDRIYLRLKWGGKYRPEEWVQLEQLYNDMMNSYDIQSAGHIDTLKLLCKTSLKANQLIDLGDVEGFQKMSKVYDSLMKSGKFTAQQNKAESGEYVDSISELVAICEEEGFIPKYYTDGPQDKVDRVLEDLQRYTHTLVTEEMGLGNLIENALKQIEQDKMALEDFEDEDEDEAFEEALFDYDTNLVIQDEDFEEFKAFEEELELENEEYFRSLEEGEI